jgi:two-component system chemotaxis response regulator CheB
MGNQIAGQDNALESGLLKVGELTPYTCPTCHGALLQLRAGRFVRFRCHTGHAYAARSFLAELKETIDDALWNTQRALEESALLMEHMAEHLHQEAPTAASVTFFMEHAQEARPRPVIPPVEVQETVPDAADEPPAP